MDNGKENGNYFFCVKQIESGVYGDLILKYPKPYSIHLRGTIVMPGSMSPQITT